MPDARHLPRWLAARLGRRWLALGALAALLLAMLLAARWMEPLLAWLLTLAPLLDQHPLGGAVAFVVLSAASAVVAFFSSAVLVPAAVSAITASAENIVISASTGSNNRDGSRIRGEISF